jgi:hypothetical protein
VITLSSTTETSFSLTAHAMSTLYALHTCPTVTVTVWHMHVCVCSTLFMHMGYTQAMQC